MAICKHRSLKKSYFVSQILQIELRCQDVNMVIPHFKVSMLTVTNKGNLLSVFFLFFFFKTTVWIETIVIHHHPSSPQVSFTAVFCFVLITQHCLCAIEVVFNELFVLMLTDQTWFGWVQHALVCLWPLVQIFVWGFTGGGKPSWVQGLSLNKCSVAYGWTLCGLLLELVVFFMTYLVVWPTSWRKDA